MGVCFTQSCEVNIIKASNKDGDEVVRINHDGRIFWNQREVETDDDFRNAMLELKDIFCKQWR